MRVEMRKTLSHICSKKKRKCTKNRISIHRFLYNLVMNDGYIGLCHKHVDLWAIQNIDPKLESQYKNQILWFDFEHINKWSIDGKQILWLKTKLFVMRIFVIYAHKMFTADIALLMTISCIENNTGLFRSLTRYTVIHSAWSLTSRMCLCAHERDLLLDTPAHQKTIAASAMHVYQTGGNIHPTSVCWEWNPESFTFEPFSQLLTDILLSLCLWKSSC